jgi:hypothetical protein
MMSGGGGHAAVLPGIREQRQHVPDHADPSDALVLLTNHQGVIAVGSAERLDRRERVVLPLQPAVERLSSTASDRPRDSSR